MAFHRHFFLPRRFCDHATHPLSKDLLNLLYFLAIKAKLGLASRLSNRVTYKRVRAFLQVSQCPNSVLLLGERFGALGYGKLSIIV